jgi:hypothetical protein
MKAKRISKAVRPKQLRMGDANVRGYENFPDRRFWTATIARPITRKFLFVTDMLT